MNTNTPKYTGLEIAVVGMSGRFPKASNLFEFWDNLLEGRESITFLPEDKDTRLKELYVPSAGGILEDKHSFDYEFFDYTYLEASLMDPQMRILHECVWQGLEDAGYDPYSSKDPIGIYAGASSGLIWQGAAYFSEQVNKLGHFSASHLADKDFTTTRISYKLNLKGPSQLIQTACSTSLVAIHHACRGLLMGDCKMAVAGGVSINPLKEEGYIYSEGLIRSKDGHCRAWDNEASGTVSGNGAGVVVLKRLKDALQDKDHIYAVVKGSAINNDGNRKVGFAAPSVEGQAEVIRKALKFAQVPSDTVTYIETHGTGTSLGDPIEFEGIKLGYASNAQKKCGIGSVKTNIGHLDAAAGVASFIKTVLALYHKKIPANLNFRSPNEKLKIDETRFYVVDKVTHWNTQEVRRAGVSSFGIGGTNAHVVLEEFITEKNVTNAEKNAVALLLMSARTEESLNAYKNSLHHFLQRNDSINLMDVSYTLQSCRKHFPYRYSLASDSLQGLYDELNQPGKNSISTPVEGVVWMFSGQGNNYPGMAQQLYSRNPYFRNEADACLSIFQKYIGSAENVTELFLHTQADQRDSVFYQQVFLFITEYSLARYLLYLGVIPDTLIGHSIGEIAAAAIAEVFSVEEAIFIIVTRARLLLEIHEGLMVSVALDEKSLSDFLIPGVEISVCNAEGNNVLSGLEKDMKKVMVDLKAAKIAYIVLPVKRAFHSYLVDPILDKFEQQISHIRFSEPKFKIVSNVTGKLISNGQITSAAYWKKHLREKVMFSQGLNIFKGQRHLIFLEIGPGSSLVTFLNAKDELKGKGIPLLPYSKNKNARSESVILQQQLGKFWESGGHIDWIRWHETQSYKKVSLPPYKFQKHEIPFFKSLQQPAIFSAIQHKIPKKEWTYSPVWKQLPAHIKGRGKPVEFQFISFLRSQSEETFLSSYDLIGPHAIKVIKSDRFNTINDLNFTINPRSEDDFDHLFNRLVWNDSKPIKVIFEWSLDHFDISANDHVYDNLFSLLYIARSLSRKLGNRTVEIAVLTTGQNSIRDSFSPNPMAGMLIGAAKIIRAEYSHLSCTVIDIPLSPNKKELEQLKGELYISNTDSFVLSVSGNSRWTQDYENIALDNIASENKIKQKGIYLITGGMGGMGFSFARYLAQHYQARLILITQQSYGLDAESTQDKRKAVARAKQWDEIAEWKRAGAEVEVLHVDVSDLKALRSAIDPLVKKWERIDGVIHTAGLIDKAGVIQRRSIKETGHVMNAKVLGAMNLYQAVRDMTKVDFWCFCSSIGNLLFMDKVGQVGYNAANEFLDSWSHYLASKGEYAVSINWNDWKEVGMSVRAVEESMDNRSEILSSGLTSEEGNEIFVNSINSGCAQVIVSTLSLPELLKANKHKLLEKNNVGTPAAGTPMQLNTENADLESRILRSMSEFTGVTSIELDSDFFELGGDSLKAIQFINYLNKEFSINIPIHAFYINPKPEMIVAYCRDHETGSQQASVFSIGKYVFNAGKKQRMFCFPPAIGMGFVYQSLAKYLLEYELICFNYIVEDDRVERYVGMIEQLGMNDEITVMAYSAGGGLAYEVVKALEAKGVKVNKLILLDTYIYRYLDKAQDEVLISDFFEKWASLSKDWLSPDHHEEATTLFLSYFNYSNSLISQGEIEADVYMIKADDNEKQELFHQAMIEKQNGDLRKYNSWNALTKGAFYLKDGKGNHNSMLSDENVAINAGIISWILDNKR